MTIEDSIRRVAIDEAINRSWDLTKQFLDANSVKLADGRPVIEDVIIDTNGKSAEVYFPIENEDYYFVVYLDIGDEVSVRWMGMSAGNKVELRVVSEDRSVSEMLVIFDITPTKQWEKGQPRSSVPGPSKFSGFSFSPTTKRTGETEDKLKALVEFLTPHRESLVRLSKIAEVEISIAYYGYKDEMWGIHFDPDLLEAVARLRLPIDIDLYAGGPDLE